MPKHDWVLPSATTADKLVPPIDASAQNTRSVPAADDSFANRDPDVRIGLTISEIRQRRAQFGPNTLPDARRGSFVRVLLRQFADVMVLVLLTAGAVAAIVGETIDVVVIAAIVILNAVLGAVQEHRAERALAALRTLAAPTARVRRAGEIETIPSADLVPGDVVLVEAGNLIPAELRLVDAAQLEVAEALLTGESEPVRKTTEPPPTTATALGDRCNVAFQGTTVTRGRGVGIVTATAVHTQLGQIAASLEREPTLRTPLQRRLDHVGRRLSAAAIALCAVILIGGMLAGEPFGLMLLTALSASVAAIPEALPAVVTMTLAIGARRLARQNALIRRLPAVETLGSVTFICSDKTGTLTENRIRVEALEIGSDTPLTIGGGRSPLPLGGLPRPLVEAMALSNDVSAEADGHLAGDPTEVALCRFAADAGYLKYDVGVRLPRVAELSFSSERARMTTLHRPTEGHDTIVAFTKGAPERVLPACIRQATARGVTPIDRKEVLRAAETMAGAGLRVLAIATRGLPAIPTDLASAEAELTLLGLVGLADPPRAEARDAVSLCRSAGIHVVMITGDHAATALAIARRLGIAREGTPMLTGSDLLHLSDAELSERVGDVRVYARVAPADKIRIVKALQARGELVAMTGDGVNDAPALQRADIGIAMGRSGTDVAREAAAIVLLDDNFATIVAAVREGRRIYDNIRKFIHYILAGNTGEIVALLGAPLLGMPLPLLPIQILWVNLVTDGLPGLALAAEPAERDIMKRPPRRPDESVFARGLWQNVLWGGLFLGGVTLLVEAVGLRIAKEQWRSMTFTVLTLGQMGQILALRSERQSLVGRGIFSNPALLGAIGITVVSQIAVVYVPWLQRLFRTNGLGLMELSIVVGASCAVFAALEVEKLMRRWRVEWPR